MLSLEKMELKIVKNPLQDGGHYYHLKPDDEYVEFIIENNLLKKITPVWCVGTYQCKESDGGLRCWIKYLKEVDPEIVYLYDIQTLVEDNETYYLVRADLQKTKKFSIKE